MTDKEIADRISYKQNALTWWENKLAKTRKASLLSIRSAQCSMISKEIAELKGIQFARHCNEQV